MVVGSEDAATVDDANGDKTSSSLGTSSSSSQCSICLDLVSQNGDQSRAKLTCGHEFHLDCIGSAFNSKGSMQCPNCRKVERGRWLYANNSSGSFSHISTVDWTFDRYGLHSLRMPFRVHWCPFSGLRRGQTSFEEVESPSATYNDLQEHHPVFPEHASGSHSHLSRAATNSNGNVDDPNPSIHWNRISRHNETFAPHTFPSFENLYQSGARPSPPLSVNNGHINSADQAPVPPATLRSDSSTRFGTFLHPFLYDDGHFPSGGSSFFSPTVHPGNHGGPYERPHVSHTNHHQQPGNPSGIFCPGLPGVRRFNGSRGFPSIIPVASQSDHNGGFVSFPPSSSSRNLHETENPSLSHFQPWERDRLSRFPVVSVQSDSGWRSFHHPSGGSDSSSRTSSFWQRNWY